MRESSYIPYGLYWSTPFARWQGSLAHLHSIEFAAHVAKSELAKRGTDPAKVFDYAILGTTVPQAHSFYGLPWLTGLLGAEALTGGRQSSLPTSARCLAMADQEIRTGRADCALVLTADRVSNGPHLYYPNPAGPGGTGSHEDWVLDNFQRDPFAGLAMLDTAENVAARFKIDTGLQHEVVLRRYEQYEAALAGERAFQRRYMTLPFDVPDAKLRKTASTLPGDEGIHPVTAEGLARLKPVKPGEP